MPAHTEHETFYTYFDTPVGVVMLAGCRDHGLRAISFQCGKGAHGPEAHWTQSNTPFCDVIRQLTEYFRGRRTTFDLPLHPTGTPFQRDVWKALLTIPYGETRSYGDIAKQIGRPTSRPELPITRWQGTTMGSGFRPLARPTARTAVGRPICFAMSPYERVSP